MRTQIYLVGLIAVGLAVGSLLMASAASACKGSKSGMQSASLKHGMRGRIVSINGNSITVATHQHHKTGQAVAGANANAATGTTKTFRIGANTRVAFVAGKSATMATLNDLKPGEEVMIEGPGGVAQKIAIMHHEHHKKAAA